MKFYTIDDYYINYLKNFEKRIWNNFDKDNKRPYVGIVITNNSFDYYAPLTSPKPKNMKWRDSLTTIRLDDHNGLYGFICLNNMIPVKNGLVKFLDFTALKDKKYLDLLNKENNIIRKKKNRILKNANNLYKETTKKIIVKPFIKKIKPYCFDFKDLEDKLDNYKNLI